MVCAIFPGSMCILPPHRSTLARTQLTCVCRVKEKEAVPRVPKTHHFLPRQEDTLGNPWQMNTIFCLCCHKGKWEVIIRYYSGAVLEVMPLLVDHKLQAHSWMNQSLYLSIFFEELYRDRTQEAQTLVKTMWYAATLQWKNLVKAKVCIACHNCEDLVSFSTASLKQPMGRVLG